jgi:hypothetical protein
VEKDSDTNYFRMETRHHKNESMIEEISDPSLTSGEWTRDLAQSPINKNLINPV